jgi:hypothetical protein
MAGASTANRLRHILDEIGLVRSFVAEGAGRVPA